jgi:hypothetical protein
MSGSEAPPDRIRRPAGIRPLALFFAAGAAIAAACAIAFSTPGGALEPMWRLNTRAKESFDQLGGWSIGLMIVVAIACASAAVGLWRGRRGGWLVASGLLTINLAGDLVNGVFSDRRALAGVPVAALMAYLGSRRVRAFFRRSPAGAIDRREETWTASASS